MRPFLIKKTHLVLPGARAGALFAAGLRPPVFLLHFAQAILKGGTTHDEAQARHQGAPEGHEPAQVPRDGGGDHRGGDHRHRFPGHRARSGNVAHRGPGGQHHQRDPVPGRRGPRLRHPRPGARLRRHAHQDAEPDRSVRVRRGVLQRHGPVHSGQGVPADRHHPGQGMGHGLRPLQDRQAHPRLQGRPGRRPGAADLGRRGRQPDRGSVALRVDGPGLAQRGHARLQTRRRPAARSRPGRSCSAPTSRAGSPC